VVTRIVYVNQIDITEPTGQGVREKEMITRLLADEEVDGYYVGQKPALPSPIDGHERVRLIPLPKKNVFEYGRFQAALLKHLLRLTRRRSSKDTVMFVRYAPAMVWPAMVSKWRKIPMMLRTGPTLYNLDFYKGGVSRTTRTLVRMFSGLHYRTAVGIQTVAERSAEIICDMYRNVSLEKFSIIPCASNPEVFYIVDEPALPDDLAGLKDKRIVCFVGALIPDIGVEHIIKAAAMIARQEGYDDVVTVIVGAGSAMAGLQQQAKDAGIQENVVFVGAKTQAYINQLLNVARAAVLPWGTKVWDDKGASPTKLFEYLAAGTFSVGTRHQVTEFIDKHDLGLLCNKDDPADMAEKLKIAVDNPASIEAKQHRREYILRHHTWEIVYKEMRDFWLSALNHTGT